MRPTLQALSERGLHIGAVSNADTLVLDRIANVLGVRDLFDSLLCSEEARSCKPDGAIFRPALERAECAPGKALFVGDSPGEDIAGAQALGCEPY
jgi:putative hydrolase of the HAD superfamily